MAIGYMYFAMFHFPSCVYNLYKIQEFIESIKRIQSVFFHGIEKILIWVYESVKRNEIYNVR